MHLAPKEQWAGVLRAIDDFLNFLSESMRVGPKYFKLTISQEDIRARVDDSKFVLVIKLCRFANQISFLLSSYPQEENRELSPLDNLKTFNAFLYLVSVLHEGMKFLEEQKEGLNEYSSFKEGTFRLNEIENIEEVKKLVKRVRDQAVSHVDEKQIRKTLRWLVNLMDDPLPFVTTDCEGKEFHFQFSDDVVLNFMIGKHEKDAVGREIFERQIRDVNKVAKEFIELSKNIVNEFMDDADFPLSDFEQR